MHNIKLNIKNIQKNIADTLNQAGRTDEVTLIGVTKTVSSEMAAEALDSGVLDLGENKVQELNKKYEVLGKKARWHLIGTLQTNKVKYIINKTTLIHSLDRLSLAEEIDKRAGQNNIVVDCLIQVNISLEDTKHGLLKEDVPLFIKEVSKKFKNIKVRGLMGMAPFEENPEDARPYFREMKALFENIKSLNLENVDLKYLSMGMTNDYRVAIEEGSNMVRVGTAIFGERNYD
ncbi:pyridoxal phosphate enzyme (YggS family) [Acetoanaerobium pronyense]|uniref:Pyridoxal phosphate homeostasis protein n=1 Tax=Acetoanaerobium pronyense TaxID=1482736 RepID=A0ABS4KH19_9FIRM|nr:YggS family pyridoxal phosphate-dependent enzyme [Acetoanaerobium pronyense]MBP2026655.1 pyridoxal phosphate enzyme (YggS family) [Acetoanaerobium pronyense]